MPAQPHLVVIAGHICSTEMDDYSFCPSDLFTTRNVSEDDSQSGSADPVKNLFKAQDILLVDSVANVNFPVSNPDLVITPHVVPEHSEPHANIEVISSLTPFCMRPVFSQRRRTLLPPSAFTKGVTKLTTTGSREPLKQICNIMERCPSSWEVGDIHGTTNMQPVGPQMTETFANPSDFACFTGLTERTLKYLDTCRANLRLTKHVVSHAGISWAELREEDHNDVEDGASSEEEVQWGTQSSRKDDVLDSVELCRGFSKHYRAILQLTPKRSEQGGDEVNVWSMLPAALRQGRNVAMSLESKVLGRIWRYLKADTQLMHDAIVPALTREVKNSKKHAKQERRKRRMEMSSTSESLAATKQEGATEDTVRSLMQSDATMFNRMKAQWLDSDLRKAKYVPPLKRAKREIATTMNDTKTDGEHHVVITVNSGDKSQTDAVSRDDHIPPWVVKNMRGYAKSLMDAECIHGRVVDDWCYLVASYHKDANVHALSYHCLEENKQSWLRTQLLKILEQSTTESNPLVLIPANILSKHWILIVLHFALDQQTGRWVGCLVWYDSLPCEELASERAVRLKALKQSLLPTFGNVLVKNGNEEFQDKTNDCGLCVMNRATVLCFQRSGFTGDLSVFRVSRQTAMGILCSSNTKHENAPVRWKREMEAAYRKYVNN